MLQTLNLPPFQKLRLSISIKKQRNPTQRKYWNMGLYSWFSDRASYYYNRKVLMYNVYLVNSPYSYSELSPVLSCVIYSLIENYVCIDYLFFQSKTLSSISSKLTFEKISFYLLLGIGILELLLNLVSCHGFMKKPNSTVILNFLYCLI